MASQTVPRRRFRPSVVLVAWTLVFILMVALLEVLLRLALPPADFLVPILRDDPHLGLVIAPGTQGHDEHGFRNAGVPARADVVAIGDSFTYGYNATRAQSWPAQLAANNGLSVYNAGLGGFGSLQHLRLMDTVVPKLKPRSVIVAFYMGNDLMDAYNLTQLSERWVRFRTSERVPGRVTEVDREGIKQSEADQSVRRLGRVRDRLAQHSMVYGVLRTTVLGPLASWCAHRSSTETRPLDDHMPWSDAELPATATVFSARMRLLSMDGSVPEVREGFEITGRALAAIKASADRQGVRLHYVLVPTKEHVYCQTLVHRKVKLPSSHERLCTIEPLVMRELSDVLKALDIPFKDVTSELSEDVMRGERLFLPSKDGHLNAAGYRRLALAINEAWPRSELLR